MKILIYDKETGVFDSLREYPDTVEPSFVFDLIYGGKANQNRSSKEAIEVGDDFKWDSFLDTIIDVPTKKFKKNPNYTPPPKQEEVLPQ